MSQPATSARNRDTCNLTVKKKRMTSEDIQTSMRRRDPASPLTKKKRAMLAWEMIEQLMGNDNSESESEEVHEANVSVINDTADESRICFMALDDNSEVTSHTEDYDFEEM